MIVFGDSPGSVQAIQLSGSSRLASISFDDITYEKMMAIITMFRATLPVGYQISDSIGKDATLLAFDENVGQVTVHGLMFDNRCGTINAVDRNSEGGPERMLKWWSKNNLTRRSTPVKIRIGRGFTIRAYVADLTIDANDTDSMLWNFTMTLVKIPYRASVGDDPFAAVNPAAPQGIAEAPPMIGGVPAVAEVPMAPGPPITRQNLTGPITGN